MDIHNRYLIVTSGNGRNKAYKILDMRTATLSDETYYKKPVDECAKLNTAQQPLRSDGGQAATKPADSAE